jgi:hypothetical protein
MSVRDVVQAAAGVGGDKLYVEDVFSTYLYTGTSAPQTITNGIDLAGEGGLVWIKARGLDTPYPQDHSLIDTERGPTTALMSNTTSGNSTQEYSLGTNGTFNSNGFTIASTNNQVNNANVTVGYASWTFRKAPKFFDVVTWTGNGANRTIAHNLGSVPGSIWVKRTDTTSNWQVYHRSLANTQYLVLNSTAAAATGATRWNSTTPTSSVFSLGTDTTVNASAGTYIAYLFAHDAGGFGDDGQQNVISCGSFTTDASGNATVTLGYEPQYILMKLNVNGVVNWVTYDIMRGWGLGNVAQLYPNINQAEDAYTGGPYFFPTATGFVLNGTLGLGSNQTNAYIAIRRPMKTPESGTEVFNTVFRNASSGLPQWNSGFVTDFTITMDRTGSGNTDTVDRLRGPQRLLTHSTSAESSGSPATSWDYMDGRGSTAGSLYDGQFALMFKRAPGFMDAVCYTGDGATPNNVTHNLGVLPELVMVKGRSNTGGWFVWLSSDPTFNYLLSSPDFKTASLRIAGATSSSFAVNNSTDTNTSTYTYVAHLFASLPGVSKVGSYTGTGADLNVDCGFSAGARFILIKRTDGTGDWYIWNSLTGIVAGNDPYLLLNSETIEVTNTDYIDPLSSGFTVTSSAPAALNASGGSYIFLAIA